MARLKQRTRRISLEFMGEEWEDGFVEFRTLTWADASKMQAEDMNEQKAAGILLDTLKGMFIKGQGVGEGGQMVEMEASDLDQLDLEAIAAITQQVAGQPSPNA